MRRSLAALLLWAAIAAAAAAHDGEDPMAVWYRSLQDANGKSCCSDRDCAVADARLTDDHWEVWIQPYEGFAKWVRVPAEAILRHDNPDGRPILCRTPNGYIRCFVPPSGT